MCYRVLRLLFGVAFFSSSLVAEDWPQFRGPGGQGHAASTVLPLHWSESENVVWKVFVPGVGHSSPIVSGDQVWLTSAVDDGRSLRVLCFRRPTGEVVHDLELFRLDEAGKAHSKNSYASPTPVLDEERVYIHFGHVGTACVSRSGELVWKTVALDYVQPYSGGSSPVLFEDLLILNCDGSDRQFVVALDKRNGEVIWKSDRQHLLVHDQNIGGSAGFMKQSYATPLVVEVHGVPHLISPGADHVSAYDARTGREIWWLGYKGFSEVIRPVVGHDLVFVGGFENISQPVLYAIRPTGSGEIGRTHVEWALKKGAPHVPSPLLVGDELFLINDRGIAICLDAKTGVEHWKERIGGNHFASPIYAGGRIYCFSEEGKTTIFAASKQFSLEAENQIDGGLMASPAVAGSSLFLRSETQLYRIEQRS
ncbi:MAG: PQQ-like beta-propeller repeat protein [Planctomycetes bacterium]|nr:PQQ-like beta-propeller repeat protein [Planctomycetota bacterium]